MMIKWKELKDEKLQCGDFWASENPNTPERQSELGYNLQMQAVHNSNYGRSPVDGGLCGNGSFWRPVELVNGKPSPSPEMWICPTATKGSHSIPHEKNEACHMGLNKCVPYVAESKEKRPECEHQSGGHFDDCTIKEKSYAERQAEWVKTNGVKLGDRVKIITSNHHAPKHLNGIMGIIEHIDDERIDVKCRGEQYNYSYKYDELEIVPQIAPAPAVKLPEWFESHKINKGDFVKISFNGAQLTLSHNAEVLYVPVEFGDYWILKDVYTGDVHYVSELCTITKLFEKKGV